MSHSKHDAIDILTADHREAEQLFEQFESVKESGKVKEKREIVRKVCAALLIHMQIEESILYPLAREGINEDALLDEAIVEHKAAKDLIRQLGNTSADDPMFDAKTKVLSEQIDHHVSEEERKLFPKLRKSAIDLEALGIRLVKEKARLERAHNMI